MDNKNTYNTILFDLDGTLTDPKVGITRCVQYALSAFGINEPDLDRLESFIGPPLRECFMLYYGLNEAQAVQAIAKYRERFSDTGIFENELYDGIKELLDKLTKSGKRVILATSKPTVYAVRILEHFNIAQFFAFISGSELDGRRTDKAEVIRHAIEQMNITDTRSLVMVGDREYDIIGAKQTGLDSIGVLYGYGSREELISAGADRVAGSVEELGSLLGV